MLTPRAPRLESSLTCRVLVMSLFAACENPLPMSATPLAGNPAPVAPAAPQPAPAGSGALPSAAGSGGVAGATLATAGMVAPAPDTGASGTAAASSDAGAAGSVPVRPNDRPPSANSDPRFMNLAPPLGAALDGVGTAIDPPAPEGWLWYAIDGAVCRDGSPTGFFVHQGTAPKLVIYLEGGGACSNDRFCGFNPESASTALSGDGQTVIGTALGTVPDRQQPGIYSDATHFAAPAGLFDFADQNNPFRDWHQIYVPYCTGDVFFGTKRDGAVPGLANQQFVGHLNMKLFIGRIVPTYRDRIERVVLTGASAGAFGAVLNYSMVQDAFGEIPVDVVDDSGPPFTDRYMPVCMQKRWREQWGFDQSLPPDCTTCRQEDGGNLLGLADFLLEKHPNARIALISSMQDEVIRLFFSVGLDDCSSYDVADPVEITVGQVLDPAVLFDAQRYSDGLMELRSRYASTGKLATYYIGGTHTNLHQHIFRPEFTTATVLAKTPAQFVTDFLNGKVEQVGP